MKRLRKTPDGSYTMRSHLDGVELELAQPPRFSIDDRHARFRYALKRDEWLGKGS